jgi:hypothetical protein
MPGLGAFQEQRLLELALYESMTPKQRLEKDMKDKHTAWINSGTKTPSVERTEYMLAFEKLSKFIKR